MPYNWNFNKTEAEQADSEKKFTLIPVGKHRVRIEDAEETTSQNGDDMWKITLAVSGFKGKLWYYLVFNGNTEERRKMTNLNLMNFWDSFGISEGDMTVSHFIGKVGACKVKHRDYNGEKQAAVHYFLKKVDQKDLPTWMEPEVSTSGFDSDFIEIDDSIPF